MKTYILSAVALAALAGTAFAQQPPAPPPAGAPVPAVDAASPPPAPGSDAQPRDYAAPSSRGPEEGLGPHAHRPPLPPPSKAAHFRIEDGETKIDVKCADDEPMKACSDIVLSLMDRLEAPAR